MCYRLLTHSLSRCATDIWPGCGAWLGLWSGRCREARVCCVLPGLLQVLCHGLAEVHRQDPPRTHPVLVHTPVSYIYWTDFKTSNTIDEASKPFGINNSYNVLPFWLIMLEIRSMITFIQRLSFGAFSVLLYPGIRTRVQWSLWRWD